MRLSIILVSLLKLLTDLYALPDLYTFLLAKQSKNEKFSIFYIAPACFLLDIIFNTYFCIFFIVDFFAYKIWKYLNLKNAFLLYLFRYFGLYLIGCSLFQIFSGLCWGMFFILVLRDRKLDVILN